MELDRLVTIPPHWQQICEDSQFNAVLEYMRGKVVEACVRNQLIVCKSSYSDESQMARQWVDETGGSQEQAMASIAEHLTRRELNDYWTVRFWSQR